jgi:hypothetical protein
MKTNTKKQITSKGKIDRTGFAFYIGIDLEATGTATYVFGMRALASCAGGELNSRHGGSLESLRSASSRLDPPPLNSLEPQPPLLRGRARRTRECGTRQDLPDKDVRWRNDGGL